MTIRVYLDNAFSSNLWRKTMQKIQYASSSFVNQSLINSLMKD